MTISPHSARLPARLRAAVAAGLKGRGRRVVDLAAVALAFAVVIALALPANRAAPTVADARPVLAQSAP